MPPRYASAPRRDEASQGGCTQPKPILPARCPPLAGRAPRLQDGGDRDDATGVSARMQVALAVMLLAPVLCGRPNRKRRGLAGRVAAHGVPSRW